ncbi:MAG: hypothetical protein LQ340_001605 [Diploschistes diacapsis]|nr:MAG: hypothetical protein LQ340_001605 [Diploschistes diacapsis]
MKRGVGQANEEDPSPFPPVNLDFDARVPVPFSIFPSSYRNSDVREETTVTKVEAEVDTKRVGREDRYSSFEANINKEDRPRRREDIRVYEERDRHERDRFPEVELSRDRYREPARRTQVNIDIERERKPREDSEIDVTEREYRRRFQGPTYDVEYERRAPEGSTFEADFKRREGTTYDVEYERRAPREHIHVEAEKKVYDKEKSKMGYYDDEGRYHSFRRGIERAADRIMHPVHGGHHDHEEVRVEGREEGGRRESVRFVERPGGVSPGTVTIPCHHIRIGDLVMLQGRPCQVIRITTSAQTGQHRYLGVDLFTKQLHEESSFMSNPSPSVYVQTMLGPVFKQYRVLDIHERGVVAMTESGDVIQSLPVIDQGSLWGKLSDAFADGRGSVRVMVINDGGRELAVDYKVIHGSRL